LFFFPVFTTNRTLIVEVLSRVHAGICPIKVLGREPSTPLDFFFTVVRVNRLQSPSVISGGGLFLRFTPFFPFFLSATTFKVSLTMPPAFLSFASASLWLFVLPPQYYRVPSFARESFPPFITAICSPRFASPIIQEFSIWTESFLFSRYGVRTQARRFSGLPR